MKFANESDVYLRFANIVASAASEFTQPSKVQWKGYKHKLGKSLKLGLFLWKIGK